MLATLRRFPTARVLSVAAPLSLAVALILALVVAPPDALQGQSVRLMYLHVPAAIGAYLCYGLAVLAGLAYLRRRDLAWDRRARAAVELGVGLTALTLIEGSIWARPTWGVYWTWDPRLVTTALLFLVFLGYLALRMVSADPHRVARRGAIFSMLGFILVPVDHFCVIWFPSIHQPPQLVIEDPRMIAALVVSMVAFALLGAWIYLRRVAVLAELAAPATVSDQLNVAPEQPAALPDQLSALPDQPVALGRQPAGQPSAQPTSAAVAGQR